MKICWRALNFVQIINEDGEVRLCAWLRDGGIIGRLTEQSMEEIFHSVSANKIRDMHFKEDYSNCDPNLCPYIATGEFAYDDVDEIPTFPDNLYLAYENVCNYRCLMCGIPECAERVKADSVEEKLNRIDEELRKVLPYVKHISANGQGEVFVCKHIMQLLSEWRPVADPKECSVSIETNGSLFNEKNWAKISNLGQYKLNVAVTILSFDEKTYQHLSGTTLPISNLIENLRFIKKLREEGIIDYLELCTVYQEENFRTLPEFCKRCIEEFGADYVRLRPYELWGGREETLSEWFKDVRNVHHPYHEEFLEVMKDPIFKHPKVHDWGGGLESGHGPEPYVRTRYRFELLNRIMLNDFEEIVSQQLSKNIIIYGMGIVGKSLVKTLKHDFNIIYCMDRSQYGYMHSDIEVYGTNQVENMNKDADVIISVSQDEEMIRMMLKDMGYTGKIVTISELVGMNRKDFA